MPLGQHQSEQKLGPRALSLAQRRVWGGAPGPWVGAGRGQAPGWGRAGAEAAGLLLETSVSHHVRWQVAAEYKQVHRTMTQPPVRDYVPFPWTTLVHVKAEYFCALAHYHAAVALCDSPRECPGPPVCVLAQALAWRGSRPSLTPAAAEEDFPVLPQAFLGPPATLEPWGAVLPQGQEERRNLGEAASWGGCLLRGTERPILRRAVAWACAGAHGMQPFPGPAFHTWPLLVARPAGPQGGPRSPHLCRGGGSWGLARARWAEGRAPHEAQAAVSPLRPAQARPT